MEFAEFFSAISFYYFAPTPPGTIELKWDNDGKRLSWTSNGDPLVWTTPATDVSQLRVIGISFNSPGWVDLTGAGVIMRELRILIQYLCERRERINSLELDNEEKKIRIKAMQRMIDPQAEQIDQSKLPLLFAENSPILDLIAQRKISGSSKLDNENS